MRPLDRLPLDQGQARRRDRRRRWLGAVLVLAIGRRRRAGPDIGGPLAAALALGDGAGPRPRHDLAAARDGRRGAARWRAATTTAACARPRATRSASWPRVQRDGGRAGRRRPQRRELVANVSHELRTPIGALQALLENLVDGVEPPDPARCGPRWRRPSGSAGSSSQLLDLSRLESGGAGAATGALSAARPARAGRARVRARRPARAAEGVRRARRPARDADPERLHQVVANLLDNAVRHSPPDGACGSARTAAGRRRRRTRSRSPTRARASRPPRPSACSSASTASTPPATRDGGTGLGLAIARWIVDAHGGARGPPGPAVGGPRRGSHRGLHLRPQPSRQAGVGRGWSGRPARLGAIVPRRAARRAPTIDLRARRRCRAPWLRVWGARRPAGARPAAARGGWVGPASRRRRAASLTTADGRHGRLCAGLPMSAAAADAPCAAGAGRGLAQGVLPAAAVFAPARQRPGVPRCCDLTPSCRRPAACACCLWPGHARGALLTPPRPSAALRAACSPRRVEGRPWARSSASRAPSCCC